MMTAKQQADFKRCAYFIAEMITKYGVEVLEETANEKTEADNTDTTVAWQPAYGKTATTFSRGRRLFSIPQSFQSVLGLL